MASTRRQMGSGPGLAQWMVLGGAVLVMLGLTFALGLLVGRQWARQTASAVIAPVAESARKPVPAPRRSGLAAEAMADRVPEPTEKLTFYRTLTEPLDGPAPGPRTETKPVAVKIPPATPGDAPPAPKAPAPAAGATARAPVSAPPPSLPPAPGRGADGGTSSSPWTIQVGAYKNRRQADDSRQQLVAAGLDAYVVTLAAQDGVARYRVRVGTYRSREEAIAAAERLRAQRSLATFVTPK